jgi:VIT1/CCC1 family predicted Fe2+/Mn2+ transporter
MEWKEHIAWIVPIVATSGAFVVTYYGRRLTQAPAVRKAVIWMLLLSFGAAAVAGIFGAFINKVAATR